MFFDTKKDWKQFLTPEDERKLNDILKNVSKHRGAYKNADEIKFAQLWCTILELRKENLALQKRLERLEDVMDGAFERIKKREKEREELERSLERF